MLEQTDDVDSRILVEGRGRLVGEHQPWVIHQGPADRDPLAFAARQKSRLVIDAVAEPEALQDSGAAPPHLSRRGVAELRRHFDVLEGGQRVEQIVHLKNETDVSPYSDEFAAAQPRQIAAEHLDPPLLDRAQRPDQGQEGGLAGPRGTGHHDQLTRRDLDPIVEQDLVSRLAFTVVVVQPFNPHDGLGCGRLHDRRRVGPFGDHRGAHQNTSAGSALITRRTASTAETRHMPRVKPRLSVVTFTLMCNGNSATRPMT